MPTIPPVPILAWLRLKAEGILPVAGGLLDQPLRLLVQMLAIDRVWQVWHDKLDDDHAWSKFGANELRLIVEVEEMLISG